jgi:hypothetical protein
MKHLLRQVAGVRGYLSGDNVHLGIPGMIARSIMWTDVKRGKTLGGKRSIPEIFD